MSINYTIHVHIAEQMLVLFDDDKLVKRYMVATAKNGIGQIEGSECTPLGNHEICEKIGEKLPENAVLIGRQWTEELYSEELNHSHPERDWILTRILWLEGKDEGLNLGEYCGADGELSSDGSALSCDTKGRYIYIHGCPDSHAMQIPSSHGCIKMRNADIIELFEWVTVGTPVSIVK